jgi:hypothetical protein
MTTRTRRKPPLSECDRDEAAKLILGEYFDFLLGGPPPGEKADAKAVAARHAAGKGILAHLEQLFKTAGGPDTEAGTDALGGQLDAARAAMASLDGEEADGDDAGDG